MARVELKQVRKVYPGGVEAVKGADLVIEDREFVVLVGPSGCGKSTTLRMVAGLEDITSGEIYIDGKLVNDVAPKDRDIAMVFQNYALYPHMTVYKNMAFGLMLRGYDKKTIEARVREAADILDIGHLLDRKPKALSGGQRQRVAVGRAIVRNPKVFLFDEPLSNLDAKLRVQMRAEISKLHARLDATMMYVTHDQVEAMTMGDRIVVMLDGVIQQVAPPMELYQRPANRFVAEFIGSPPMNILRGTLHAENGTLNFVAEAGDIRLELPATHHARLERHVGQTILLGIRPEDISVTPEPRPGNTFSATADVIEPMGAEVYAYFQTTGQTLTARLKPDNPPHRGEHLHLQPTAEKLHYFDDTSSSRI